MLAGIGRKLRIDVGGKVVDVRVGRLVERVCVEVVGCVVLFKGVCVVSDPLDVVVVGVDDAAVLEIGTGTEMFALMM